MNTHNAIKPNNINNSSNTIIWQVIRLPLHCICIKTCCPINWGHRFVDQVFLNQSVYKTPKSYFYSETVFLVAKMDNVEVTGY